MQRNGMLGLYGQRTNNAKMNHTFTVGQKVERKGKFYIVCKETYTPPSYGGWSGDVVGVQAINKKTGNAWQAPLYFHASECREA